MDHSNEHMDDVPANSMKFFYPKSSWTEVFKNIGLGKGGFLYTEVNRQEGKFQYHNGDGKLLASFPLTPRFDRPRNS